MAGTRLCAQGLSRLPCSGETTAELSPTWRSKTKAEPSPNVETLTDAGRRGRPVAVSKSSCRRSK